MKYDHLTKQWVDNVAASLAIVQQVQTALKAQAVPLGVGADNSTIPTSPLSQSFGEEQLLQQAAQQQRLIANASNNIRSTVQDLMLQLWNDGRQLLFAIAIVVALLFIYFLYICYPTSTSSKRKQKQAKANQKTLEQKHNTSVQAEQTLMEKKLTESERQIDVTKIWLNKELEEKKMALELAKVQNDIYKQSEFNK